MKINGTDPQSVMQVYRSLHVQGQSKAAGGAASKAATASQQDQLALSEQGRLVADAQRAIASVADVRTTLVSAIRHDLENGKYVVDSLKAAEGLLKEAMVNDAAMR